MHNVSDNRYLNIGIFENPNERLGQNYREQLEINSYPIVFKKDSLVIGLYDLMSLSECFDNVSKVIRK
jgi:hypothetical protein